MFGSGRFIAMAIVRMAGNKDIAQTRENAVAPLVVPSVHKTTNRKSGSVQLVCLHLSYISLLGSEPSVLADSILLSSVP